MEKFMLNLSDDIITTYDNVINSIFSFNLYYIILFVFGWHISNNLNGLELRDGQESKSWKERERECEFHWD